MSRMNCIGVQDALTVGKNQVPECGLQQFSIWQAAWGSPPGLPVARASGRARSRRLRQPAGWRPAPRFARMGTAVQVDTTSGCWLDELMFGRNLGMPTEGPEGCLPVRHYEPAAGLGVWYRWRCIPLFTLCTSLVHPLCMAVCKGEAPVVAGRLSGGISGTISLVTCSSGSHVSYCWRVAINTASCLNPLCVAWGLGRHWLKAGHGAACAGQVQGQ